MLIICFIMTVIFLVLASGGCRISIHSTPSNSTPQTQINSNK